MVSIIGGRDAILLKPSVGGFTPGSSNPRMDQTKLVVLLYPTAPLAYYDTHYGENIGKMWCEIT